ncbi:hypothetical protein [Arsenicitalea aurantiaca]|uniref:hypothetical protein n=1 Tax=Arsenicitalea aurantiaca TaxID=1783274 RepID=UPI0013158668|nr:hypothetical protein [Arsenicitalea aurantiaca]
MTTDTGDTPPPQRISTVLLVLTGVLAAMIVTSSDLGLMSIFQSLLDRVCAADAKLC